MCTIVKKKVNKVFPSLLPGKVVSARQSKRNLTCKRNSNCPENWNSQDAKVKVYEKQEQDFTYKTGESLAEAAGFYGISKV